MTQRPHSTANTVIFSDWLQSNQLLVFCNNGDIFAISIENNTTLTRSPWCKGYIVAESVAASSVTRLQLKLPGHGPFVLYQTTLPVESVSHIRAGSDLQQVLLITPANQCYWLSLPQQQLLRLPDLPFKPVHVCPLAQDSCIVFHSPDSFVLVSLVSDVPVMALPQPSGLWPQPEVTRHHLQFRSCRHPAPANSALAGNK